MPRVKEPPAQNPWRSRIVRYGEESPSQLLANPFNFRVHTKAQQQALSGVLRKVGIVQNVLVNTRTGHMLDGHLRAAMAIAELQPTIPVTYLELTEEEEKLVLATFDTVTGMAETDDDILASLLKDISASDIGKELDDGLASLLAELAGEAPPKAGLTEEDAAPPVPEEPVTRPGDLWLLGDECTCPHCGEKN
jgi:hypothetical protein